MMKLVALLAFSAIAIVSAPRAAYAQYDGRGTYVPPAPAFTDEDLDPIVRTLSPHTYALTAPVYVYNWFNGGGRSAIWSQQFDSDSIAGFSHLQSMGKDYWQSLCTKDATLNPPDCGVVLPTYGTGNMYGPGLYLAVDPVATNEYGGGSGWVLMQIHLPKGFRVLDLDAPDSFDVPQDAIDALQKVGCPMEITANTPGKNLIDYLLLRNTESDGTGTCSLAVRKILKDRLHIDGFFYNYVATQFADCQKSPRARTSAMVLTDTRKLKPEDVKVFNAQTTDDREDRTRIEMLFYKAQFDRGYESMPATMSNDNAPETSLSSYGNNLLWQDLQGTAIPADTGDWMQSNLYQCSPNAATSIVRRHRPGMAVIPTATAGQQ